MATDSCVSCLKKQSFTCNDRKCYETSTTFDKRTMEQYCSRRPFIKCTPWKRKLQYNKTCTVSWSPAHSDKSQDYCLLPEMSLPSSVNNRLLVTAVYIIFTSILRTINTHINTQQTTRVLVFVLAISALLSGCGPYVTAESTSLSPGSQPQLELPNAITYVGMAFIYKIPSKIFNCKLDYIEISEGSSRTLPNWLAYDEHKQELYGVPSMEDLGTSYILIVAIADDSLDTGRICGMKSFTINVVAVHHQPHASVIMMASSVALESQVLHFGSGRMNENLFCTPGAQLILGTILLSANLQQVSGHERMMILNKTAQHLKVTTEKMALFSGEVDHPLVSQLKDPSVIKSGAGDGRYSKGKRSLLTWALGCGALKLNSDLLDLETSSKDGTISMLLGHPVIGWHVTSGVQRARHRGRRAILPATPTPTETSMLPTQVKSILTTVLTGSMTLMPTIIQNSTEVLQSSAVASLNVTTIVSATPSFTLSASLSIKPTVILNSTVVVNATINMSSLASSAILVYSTTSPLMNASSEASLTSTEVVNTSSVQPSSSISMTSIMQTDTMNTTFSIQPTPSINVTTVSIEMTSIMPTETMNTTFSIQPTPSINVTTVSIEMTSIMPTETMNTTLSLLPDPSINVTYVKSPSLTTSGLLQPSPSANVTTELSKPVNTSFFPQPTPSTNMSSSEVLLSWNSSIMLTPSESANISKIPSSTVSLPGNSSIMETVKVTPTSSLTTPQNTSVVFTNITVQDTLVLYKSSTPVLNISSGWNSTVVKESTTTLLLSSSSVPLNESTSNASVAINSTVQASTTIYSLPPTSMLNSTPATVSIDSIAPSPTTPPSSSSTTITTLNASVMATATPSASLEANASTMLSSGISVPSIDSTVLPDSSSYIPAVTTVVQTGSYDMNRTSSITPSFQTASIWTGTPMLTTDIVEPTINASRTSVTTIVSSASGSSLYSAFSINTTDTTLLISKSLRTTETVSMTTSINVSSTILSLLPSIVTSPIMTSVNMSSASIVNSSSIEVVDSSNTENSTLSAYLKDAMTNNVTLSTAKLPHSLGSLSPSTPISPSVVEDFVNNSTRLETIYISADVNFSLRDSTAASLVSIVTGTAGKGFVISTVVAASSLEANTSLTVFSGDGASLLLSSSSLLDLSNATTKTDSSVKLTVNYSLLNFSSVFQLAIVSSSNIQTFLQTVSKTTLLQAPSTLMSTYGDTLHHFSVSVNGVSSRVLPSASSGSTEVYSSALFTFPSSMVATSHALSGPGSTLSRTVVLTLSSVTQAITYSTISTESFVTPTSLVNDSTIFASSPVDVTPALSTKSFTSISLDSTRTSTLSASVDETSTSIKLNSSVIKRSLLTSSLWQNSLANSTLGKGLITTVLSTSSIITHPNSTAFVSSLAIQTSILVVKSSVETSIIGKSTTIANVSSILPSPSTVYMGTTSVPDNYTEVTTTHDAASSTTSSVPDIYMTLSITTGVYTSLSSPGLKNTTFTPSEIVSPSISTLHTSTVELSSTGNVSMLTLKTNSIPVTSPAPSTSLPASSTLPVLPTSSLAETPSTQSVASSGVMVTFSSVATVNSSTISADITSIISSSSLNISSAYVLSTGVLPGTTSKQSMIQPITSTSFTNTSVLFESSADVSSSSIAFDITSIRSTSVLPGTTSKLSMIQPITSTSFTTTSVLFESSADVSSSSIAFDITSILSTSVLPETTSIQSTMQPNTSTVLSSVDSVDSSSVVESSQSRTAATINSTTQESSSFQTSIYPSQSSIFRTSVLPSSYFSSTVILETSSSSASSLAPSPTATTTSTLQTTEPSSTPPTSPALTVTMTTVIATDSSITPTTVTKVIPTSTATVVIPPDLVVVNDIGRVTVTSGKVFNYQVPADTFHDRKDGNTRNLTLELYLVGPQSTQVEIPGWLQFDDKTQTISGLPMDPSETLTRGELFILKARNSRGDIAYDAFEILVLDSQTQHAVELSTRLDNNYTIFSNNLTQRLLLLSAIASFYGDASPGYIRVLRYQEGSVMFIWTNDTLPTSECDPEKNARVSNRVEEDGEVTNAFRQALAPKFPVISAYSSLVGVCNRTIIPASAIPGARDSEESSDLWVKHVLPGVLVAFILIIIAILLFLYLRRKRPKPADPERRTYKKRKPIILDPEMELKPLPGKPLVLPSDDPSQPPSYISDTSLDKAPYSYYNDDYDDDGDDEEDFKFGSFPPSPIYETPPPVYGGFEPDYRETPPPNYRLPPMYLNYTVPPWETSSDV